MMFRSGAALMIYASISFSLMAALVRFLSGRIPAFEIVLWRCALAIPVLVWLLGRRHVRLVTRNWRVLLIRSVCGFAAMSLFFIALGLLPIADTLLLAKLQPLLIALLAPLLLRERPNRLTVATVLVSLVGAGLILKPTFQLGHLGGAAILGSAVASALAHMSVRRLSADDESMVIVLNFMVVSALLSLPFTVTTAVWPDPVDLLALVGVSAFATLGQLLMTKAYAIEEAPVVSAAGYSSVICGVIWGLVWWNEVPALNTWIGGSLLVFAGLALVWSRRDVAAHGYRAPGSGMP